MFCLCAMFYAAKSFLAWSLPWECSYLVFRRVSWAVDSICEFFSDIVTSAARKVYDSVVEWRDKRREAGPRLLPWPEVSYAQRRHGTEWWLLCDGTYTRLAYWMNWYDLRSFIGTVGEGDQRFIRPALGGSVSGPGTPQIGPKLKISRFSYWICGFLAPRPQG